MKRRDFLTIATAAATAGAATCGSRTAMANPLALRIMAALGFGVMGGIGNYIGRQIAAEIDAMIRGQLPFNPPPALPPWWAERVRYLYG